MVRIITFMFLFLSCFLLANQQRWEEFSKGREFPLWTSSVDKTELERRFDQLMDERWSEYFINDREPGVLGIWKDKYPFPVNYESFHSRYPYPIVFSYNLASSNYNASLIHLHGIEFIAMEAPSEKNLEAFFNIFEEYDVNHLVRLTAAYETRENSFPYWEGRTNISSIDGRTTLELENREIYYFPTDCWKDHQGIEPERLLALVNAVMETNEDNSIITVHCRAGVGRTGTFIVAYVLVNDIKNQLANGIPAEEIEVSIDKTIWELSLQRAFAVTHYPQYETLYKLVGLLLKS